MEFHNNLSVVMKSMVKSHETLIRNVCSELNVQDQEVVNDLIKKFLDTSFTSVKAKKDPNRIKRAKSAYFFFCDDKRKEVQLANPGKSMCEMSKALGKLWKEISEEDRQKYTDQNVDDVQRYEDEK